MNAATFFAIFAGFGCKPSLLLGISYFVFVAKIMNIGRCFDLAVLLRVGGGAAFSCSAQFQSLMNILDGICPEGKILDGLDDWPRSATRKQWLRVTRELVASTIANMDLPPNELAQVAEAFIGAGLL